MKPVERGWARGLEAGADVREPIRAEVHHAFARGYVDAHVAHFCAVAAQHSRGVCLELGEEAFSFESTVMRRGSAILVKDVVSAMPALELAILQAPPSLEIGSRGAREQAICLRAFAAGLVELGVPRVIVIPVLQDEMMLEVIRLLGEALVQKNWPSALRHALTACRVIVSERLPGDPEWREAALDFSLFEAPAD
jgi:hypothetical protein